MTMKNYDIESLNEEQKLALKEINGAVLVTAGAGSGKTRLLTHRVAYLIDQLGVSPYNILAITFTNKAAGEMKERISKMVQGAENVWISTFHSMCARILRKEIGELEPYDKNFSIYSDTETDKLVKDIFNEKSIIDDKDKLKKSFYFHLSNWKNGTMKLSEYIASRSDEEDIRRIGSLIYEYEARMKKNNALDFDDLLRKTLELFLEKPHILEYYSTRFKYILVDEFQDTNSVQYKLVKMLTKVHGNVFVVGDEDQCIYSWRGANFQNIFDFKKDFQNVKVFKLERNYRSTASILNIANNVIKNNGMFDVELSIWALSQFAQGGLLAVPNSSLNTGLIANRAISLWPYSKLNDRRVYFGDKFITVVPDEQKTPAFKFGSTVDDGYACYFNHGQLVAKKFEYFYDVEYPNFGCNFESYTNEDFIEIESLTPLFTLEAGEVAVHTETWAIADNVKCPARDDEAAIEKHCKEILKKF